MTARSGDGRATVCILGSTGSIGTSTLDVLARHPQRFEVWALTAHARIDELHAQCLRWRPRHAAVATAEQARDLRARLAAASVATEVHHGPGALAELAAHPDTDIVMAAIVGAAGLVPCLAAARAGKRLLLANKEALVVGGALFMSAVREGGAELLPIDSEHTAIFQCLPRRARRSGPGASTASSSPPRAGRSATAIRPRSAASRPTRPAPIRTGSWAARSRSTRRR